MKLNCLSDLFLCLLSDIYVVENQIVDSIPVLLKKVDSEELKEGMKAHLKETKEQVKRIEKIFKLIGETPKRIDWSGDIKSLFHDADRFIKENDPSPLLDAAIIVITQRIKHFEIATYGTLREFAHILELDEVKNLLKESLKEEGTADSMLNKLAKGRLFSKGINVASMR